MNGDKTEYTAFIIGNSAPLNALRFSRPQDWRKKEKENTEPSYVFDCHLKNSHKSREYGESGENVLHVTAPRPLNYFDMIVADALWTARYRYPLPESRQETAAAETGTDTASKKINRRQVLEIVRTLTCSPKRQVTASKNRLNADVEKSLAVLSQTTVYFNFTQELELRSLTLTEVPWQPYRGVASEFYVYFLGIKDDEIHLPLYEYTEMVNSQLISVNGAFFASAKRPDKEEGRKANEGKDAKKDSHDAPLSDTPEVIIMRHYLMRVIMLDIYTFEHGKTFASFGLKKANRPYQHPLYFFDEFSHRQALFEVVTCISGHGEPGAGARITKEDDQKQIKNKQRKWRSYMAAAEQILDRIAMLSDQGEMKDRACVLKGHERIARDAGHINRNIPFRYQGINLLYGRNSQKPGEKPDEAPFDAVAPDEETPFDSAVPDEETPFDADDEW